MVSNLTAAVCAAAVEEAASGVIDHVSGSVLYAGGMLPDVDPGVVIPGTVMYLMVPVVSGPMFLKMYRMQSVASISVLYMIARAITNYWQAIAMIGESAPIVSACFAKDAGIGQCYGNIIPLCQTLVQSVGTSFVVITFTRLWLDGKDKPISEQSAPQGTQALNNFGSGQGDGQAVDPLTGGEGPFNRATLRMLLLGQFAATFGVLVLLLIWIFAGGVCAESLATLSNIIFIIATIASILGPLPQIKAIWIARDIGAISAPSITLQVIGNAYLTANFLLVGRTLFAVAPYLGVCVVNFALLVTVSITKRCRTPL